MLSLAENKISDTSELVQAIKKLPNLEVLTVKGNPLVGESEYRNILLGNLENLKYLDYIYIDESSRKTGNEIKFETEEDTFNTQESLNSKEIGRAHV